MDSQPVKSGFHSNLTNDLYLQCEAMAKFAFKSGLTLPPFLISTLPLFQMDLNAPKESPKSHPHPTPAVDDVPEQTDRKNADIILLGKVQQNLAALVAPATPRGILLLAAEAQSRWRILGPVPLIRQLLVLAVGSLIAFLGLSLSPLNNEVYLDKDLLTNSGIPLLFNECFLLSSSALGASFAALFKANKYCAQATFDPKYNASYWVRLVLGLIAGLVLTEIVNIDWTHQSISMAKPALAMLGGFSSDLVFRVLNRLVATVESLMQGDSSEKLDQQKQSAQMHAKLQMEKQRLEFARQVCKLKNHTEIDTQSPAVNQALENIMANLMEDRQFNLPKETGRPEMK